MLHFDTFRTTPVERVPYDHVIVPGFLAKDALQRVIEDFPKIDGPGSYPLHVLRFGPSFQRLTELLRGAEMARIVEEKFGIDLTGRPTMITVRGHCRPTDGKIHRDSRDKLVTVLLYLNAPWHADGGRLRLLNSPDDIDDCGAEVPPDGGTMLVFPCTANAWHGHRSFAGERRTLQLNWVDGTWYLRREQIRHSVSAFIKRIATR